MSTQPVAFDKLVSQAKRLPASERLQLVKAIIETIQIQALSDQHRTLGYGAFRGPNASTEADFQHAEWWPTDENLDGN